MTKKQGRPASPNGKRGGGSSRWNPAISDAEARYLLKLQSDFEVHCGKKYSRADFLILMAKHYRASLTARQPLPTDLELTHV